MVMLPNMDRDANREESLLVQLLLVQGGEGERPAHPPATQYPHDDDEDELLEERERYQDASLRCDWKYVWDEIV